MRRYSLYARWYDVLSGEPVYRAGRRAGVRALRLRPGDKVLDVGCGTGLNLRLLHDAVGPEGHIVGVDLSEAMLDVAAAKVDRAGWRNVRLMVADAARLEVESVTGPAVGPAGFDAVIFTYVLSLIPDWQAAYRRGTELLAPGGRVAVVDMRRPTGAARPLTPVALAACALGGADIDAHPWRLVERETSERTTASLRGGHVQVRAGSVVGPGRAP